MTMLTAFLDESGSADDPQAVSFSIAGYVAPAEEWEHFQERWQDVLGRPQYAAEYFHCREAMHRRGVFKGWPRGRIDELYRHLLAILKTYASRGVASAVQLNSFRKLVTGHALQKIDSPYSLCLQSCMLLIQKLVLAEFGEDRIILIIDRNEKFRHEVVELFEKVKERGEIAGDPLRIDRIDFRSAGKTPGLQAADVLAWETNKYMTETTKKTGRPLRKSLESLLKGLDHRSYLWNDTTLPGLASKF